MTRLSTITRILGRMYHFDAEAALQNSDIQKLLKNYPDVNEMEREQFIEEGIFGTYKKYFEFGPRSSKKTDYFHGFIQKQLETVFLSENGYETKQEQWVPSNNASGRRKCDIVVYKNEKPYVVLPVKLVMSNCKQNKNNYYENLTGELTHLKTKNPDLNIIPINIFAGKTPYLNSSKKITKYENITVKDINGYDLLKETYVWQKGWKEPQPLACELITYILDVEHQCDVGELFDKMPSKISFNTDTDHRTILNICSQLI